MTLSYGHLTAQNELSDSIISMAIWQIKKRAWTFTADIYTRRPTLKGQLGEPKTS